MRQTAEQVEVGVGKVGGGQAASENEAATAAPTPARAALSPDAARLHQVAHDLRSPLTALRLQLDLLQRTLHAPGYTVERADQQLAGAERQIERMCQLLSKLVDDPCPCLPRRDH